METKETYNEWGILVIKISRRSPDRSTQYYLQVVSVEVAIFLYCDMSFNITSLTVSKVVIIFLIKYKRLTVGM